MHWLLHHDRISLHSWIILGLVLLAVGVVVLAVVLPLMARLILSPPRMTDVKAAWFLHRLSPGDLGLQYQSLNFSIRDVATGQPLKIAAWWIAHPLAQGRCAILLHGYGDAKVGAIAWAPTFHDLGFNVLALDLRAHGQSEGRYSTGGFFERHDIDQIIDQLRAQQGPNAQRLVLFGVSLGAAVACACAVLRAQQNPPGDIDAVILECPFPDYVRAIRSHARVLACPATAWSTPPPGWPRKCPAPISPPFAPSISSPKFPVP